MVPAATSSKVLWAATFEMSTLYRGEVVSVQKKRPQCLVSHGVAGIGTNAEEGGIRHDNASNTRHGAATGVGTKALIVFGSSAENEVAWHRIGTAVEVS